MRAGRWLFAYFLLAAFDLAAVSISLSLNHHIVSRYADSIEVNRNWSDRKGIYASLGRLAADADAPGNDVFSDGAIDQEEAAMHDRAKVFRLRLRESRRELLTNINPADATPLVRLLDEAGRHLDSAMEAGEGVFTNLRADDVHAAAAQMALMDRRYNLARDFLAELDARVRLIQRRNLDAQDIAAQSLRHYELLIAALIAVMVGGVTLYGRFLVRQTQRGARERERYLAEIAEHKARLEALFLTATEGILTVRDGSRIESANPAAGAIFGIDPDSLVGRDIATLLAPESPPIRTPCTGREVAARRATGEAFPLEVAVSDEAPLPGGALTTWLVRDISSRKEIEAELTQHREHLEQLVEERSAELEASYAQLRTAERLASIGALAAGLGHDMKNLLFPMRCRLDLVGSLDLPPQASEEIAAVRSGFDYLQQLSHSLRLFALDPEDETASVGVTDPAQWWEEVGALLKRSLPQQAHFTAAIEPGVPPIHVPPHRLTQAVLNLIVNAGEAIEHSGEVTLCIHRAGDTIELAVSDTGHGMTPEARRRALDPFYTTKQRGRSTGMGLALVHAVASSSGATTTIDSEPGHGTTITLRFPISAAPHHHAPAPAPDSEAAPLVVISISDPRLASFARAVLSAAGATISRAGAPDADPAPTLWITDAHDGRALDAERFLNADERHRVVALGAPDGAAWSRPGVWRVDGAAGADRLRGAILGALRSLREEPR